MLLRDRVNLECKNTSEKICYIKRPQIFPLRSQKRHVSLIILYGSFYI